MAKKIMVIIAFLLLVFPAVVFGEVSSPYALADSVIFDKKDNPLLDLSSEKGSQNRTLFLRVMTLNIHSAINWYGQFDVEGLARLIADVNPDIVGLQEVNLGWSSMTNFADIPTELSERLHMDYAFSASRDRNNGFFGNLILSKYPITQQWTMALPGSLESRSVALVQVIVGGQRINFLTTHLGLSVSDRLQQVGTIIGFVNQISGPLIITGDFNGNDNDPAVSEIKKNLSDFQSMSQFKGNGTFRSKDGNIYPTSKMDYILASPEFGLSSLQVGGDTFVSDHVPLIANLTLNLN